MVKYDSQIVRTFADQLYDDASLIVMLYTILGCISGGLWGGVGCFLFGGNLKSMQISENMALLACTSIVGFAGFLLGRSKGFWLKLQAQVALCQVQIEENTNLKTPKADAKLAASEKAPAPTVAAPRPP